ncbi:type IV secretion system protein [Caulobacter hibisci]|uniref:Type IV secretion system protein n=1 Tax=Caulobacter hibisci TaxID=2035993 RepID=A0ABS0SRX9_9CAUL|nr:type IV secretion system protein [Caulobacter hibisci]MBI1682313.1 type IV secretion system protein [Caulobacter hibisci]
MTPLACPAADAPLVQGLIGSVDCQVHGLAQAGYAALAAPGSPVSTLLTVLMTVYVAFMGYRLVLGRGSLRIGDATIAVVKMAPVVALATNWALLETLAYDALFKAPAELGGLLLGKLGGEAGKADPYLRLQDAYDALQTAAQHFASRAGGRDSALQGGPGFAAFAANIGGLTMLLTSLGAVLACKVVLSVLLALAPLVAGLLLFETTRGLVEGWIKAMVALALLPMIATIGLALELAMMTPSLKALAALKTAQQFAPLDIAPAVTVLVLSLVFAVVLTAAAIAVSVMAAGLKLPREQRAGQGAASSADAGQAATQVEPLSRAAHVAAAAAAMTRREDQAAAAAATTTIGPRRLVVVSDRSAATPSTTSAPSTATAAAPLGASYRRPASPRRSAAGARRDQ